MNYYTFSNKNIYQACEQIEKFLSDSKVDRRETLRIKLAFEDILLNCQSEFGEDANFKLKCTGFLSSLKIEMMVRGKSFDPFEKVGEDSILANNLLSGMGIAPSWSYKKGKNYVVFTPKKKPLSQTVKMLISILLSLAAGFLLGLLPNNITTTISEMLLVPLTDLFMGLITAVAGPLVFLSVLGSICSMGNIETLGKIGKMTIVTLLSYTAFVGVFITLITAVFFNVSGSSGSNINFSQVIELVYDIVPSNLFEPLLAGNALQLIFIAMILGIAMLILSSKVNLVYGIAEQLNAIIQTIMSGISSLIPFAVFLIFTNMIAVGNHSNMLSSLKIILIMLMLMVFYLASMILWTSARKKISPILIIKKLLPTFMIALTTASSAAAFSTSVKDCNEKLGISQNLVTFGIPLGQVMFKPCILVLLFPMELAFAEIYGIEITITWIILAYLTNLLLSFAIPPVAGGALMGFTIAFTQLNIPLDVMGIAIAINAITDFPATATNNIGWQLSLIDVADRLDMLDKETLHSDNSK